MLRYAKLPHNNKFIQIITIFFTNSIGSLLGDTLLKTILLRIKLFLILFLPSSFVLGAEQLYTMQSPVTPELALAGQYTVGVKTITATDNRRLNTDNFITSTSRSLVLEVWYPAKSLEDHFRQVRATYKDVTRLQQPFELQGKAYRNADPVNDIKPPLVLLSHGFSGYRTQMFYLGEHLASHGYVVVGIDHTGSTNAEMTDEAKWASGGINTFYNRARDHQFVLNFLSNQESSAVASDLELLIDTNKAAIIGYSMGGFGAINTVGGCYTFSATNLKKIGVPSILASLLPLRLNSCFAGEKELDPRWKAVQVFSPWGGELDVHDVKSMKKITVPMFYVAGDQDNTSGFENGIKKLFKQTGSANKYMMVYENARHNIAGHPPPSIAFNTDFELGHYFEPSWKIETLNRVNKHMTLAFLDCHVKNDKDRCNYLPSRISIEQYQGKNSEYSEPWPGFKHLWGSGINFYRE